MNEGRGETKVAKRLQIFSKQAPMIDAMITRCVGDLNQKEEALRRKRLEQGNVEYLPEVSITSEAGGRQRQEKNYKEHKFNCEVFTPEGQLLDVFLLISASALPINNYYTSKCAY